MYRLAEKSPSHMEGLVRVIILRLKFHSPGDSIRDLFIHIIGGHEEPLSLGHVFTHHPKKVTSRIAMNGHCLTDF